jgi:hypothetical protein
MENKPSNDHGPEDKTIQFGECERRIMGRRDTIKGQSGFPIEGSVRPEIKGLNPLPPEGVVRPNISEIPYIPPKKSSEND